MHQVNRGVQPFFLKNLCHHNFQMKIFALINSRLLSLNTAILLYRQIEVALLPNTPEVENEVLDIR